MAMASRKTLWASSRSLLRQTFAFLTAALQFLSKKSQETVIFGVCVTLRLQVYFAIDVFIEFHDHVASRYKKNKNIFFFLTNSLSVATRLWPIRISLKSQD